MHRQDSNQTYDQKRMANDASRNLSGITDPIEKIRTICLKRGTTGILALGRQFRIMDYNRSGDLSYDELRQGLHEIDYNCLTDEEFEKICRIFDKDGSGTINYEEFLRAIRQPMSKFRLTLVDKAFAKLDVSGDGVITMKDLHGVYNVHANSDYLNGDKSEEQLLLEFLKNFENGTSDGRVTKDEFLDYYSGVSAAVDDDLYFDLIMRQAWKL